MSTGEKISIHTITLLWQFLTDNLEKQEIHTDVFIDLFFQLKRLQESPQIHVSSKKGQLNMKRWRCGLDKKVIEMRKTNKERMIHLLIEKIKNRKSTSSRFLFSENMNYDDKYKQVELWWNDPRFQLSMAVKSPFELNRFLGNSLSTSTMYLLSTAYKKGIPFLQPLIICHYWILQEPYMMMRPFEVILFILRSWWKLSETFVPGKRKI